MDRLLEPICSALNEEAARKLIEIRADADVQARVAELAGRCNEDELSPEERAEYERFVIVGDVFAILKAKARVLLERRERSA